jgi:ABC-type uncharacterized transport system ATPase subunit
VAKNEDANETAAIWAVVYQVLSVREGKYIKVGIGRRFFEVYDLARLTIRKHLEILARRRRRLSGHQAYPPAKQREIVQELFRLESEKDPPTREEFARGYGISDRTLRNYIASWEAEV